MPIKLGVIMDPIHSINIKKDSTFAMLLEASQRQYEIYYIEQKDLFLENAIPKAHAKKMHVYDNAKQWFKFYAEKTLALQELNIVLMRKDPPVNDEYIYTTYILNHAEQHGVLVVNNPYALRDYNEKVFATHFPECCPPSLMTQSLHDLENFWEKHQDIVCKPLNAMGGRSIFRLQKNDVNAHVVFETLTQNHTFMMAQKFIPEIKLGDKRILLIAGEPIPHALVRVPQANDWRGNLAVGAKGVIETLTPRDLSICAQLKETLRKQRLYFVGIDVIGNYLTEINITSPTGIRELDSALSINISAKLFDHLETLLVH